MRLLFVAFCVLLVLGDATRAQSSADYVLEEYVIGNWGLDSQSGAPRSNSFELALAQMGDSIVASGLSSDSFRLDVGFVARYRPPGEVAGACGTSDDGCLIFTDAQTLTWPDEPSAGTYNLYRGTMSDGSGACEQPELPGTVTIDAATPLSSEVFFYLLTVRNRLGEEGTRGFQSNMTERLGPACP